jgi:hypothetical protein
LNVDHVVGLTTDVLLRDDPAQRRVIGMDRQKAVAELGRVTKEMAQFRKTIADIEEDARRAGVPAVWLREQAKHTPRREATGTGRASPGPRATLR